MAQTTSEVATQDLDQAASRARSLADGASVAEQPQTSHRPLNGDHQRTPPAADGSWTRADGVRDRTAFAHHSEAQFARLLDFYQIKWEYEPRSFALRWAEDGRIIEQFAPDFYLPELDLYIELTTLKQRLVTKKHRKLRRLRTLYPEVRIKLLYNRDYQNLLFKYGLEPEPAGERTA